MPARPVLESAPSAFDPVLFWSLHRKNILYGSTALALVLVVFGVILGFQAVRRVKAEAAFAVAEQSGDWQAVINQFPGSPAAGNAALRLAARFAGEGKYQESDDTYDTFLRQNPKHPLLVNGYMGLAQNAENEKKLDKAVQGYAQLVRQFGSTYLAPLALFNQARLTRDKGSLKEAQTLFGAVVQRYPNSVAATLAGAEAAKLNEKLNPPPAPVAASPAAQAGPASALPSPGKTASNPQPSASLAP